MNNNMMKKRDNNNNRRKEEGNIIGIITITYSTAMITMKNIKYDFVLLHNYNIIISIHWHYSRVYIKKKESFQQ